MVTFSLILVFLSVMAMTWGLLPDLSKRLIRRRVFAEVATEGRLTALGQLVELLAPLNRWLPTTWYATAYRSRLEAGGMRMAPLHFLVLQEIGAAFGLFCYVLLLGSERLNVGWLSLFVVIGFFVPSVWLSNHIQARRMTISRDLPEVVDLLTLCVDAGIDFMNSLGRIVREFRRCPTTEELGIVSQEVQVGKRRRDALRAFSARVQTAEASSFSRTLIQADRMGTGIAEALRVLSEDMRLARYHWAERFAQQAPLKMLLPLLFSLASALIIVAGPVLGQFLQSGFSAPQFQARAEGSQ